MVYSALFHMHLWANEITEWNPSTAKIAFNVVTGESESRSAVSDSETPGTIQSMQFSRPEYWRGYPLPSPGDLTNPGIKPGSPTLQVDSLPAEPQGKHTNTWVGSLPLLQTIFPTQESSQGLLHRRPFFIDWTMREAPALSGWGLCNVWSFLCCCICTWKEHVFCCFEVMYSMKTDWVTFVYRVSPDFSFIVIFLSTCSIN